MLPCNQLIIKQHFILITFFFLELHSHQSGKMSSMYALFRHCQISTTLRIIFPIEYANACRLPSRSRKTVDQWNWIRENPWQNCTLCLWCKHNRPYSVLSVYSLQVKCIQYVFGFTWNASDFPAITGHYPRKPMIVAVICHESKITNRAKL